MNRKVVLALLVIAATVTVPNAAEAGTFVPFNCWPGVVEQGVWSSSEYDCATVDVGFETEEAVPAEPQPRQVYERVCRTHHRQGAQGITKMRTFCIGVNVKQVSVSLDPKAEALLSWEHDPYRSTHIGIQIDWIRLISSENGAVLKFKNDLGWLTCDSSCNPDAYGTSHDSWYTGACHDNDNIHIYAKARYRIKWLDLSGDPVGTYKTLQSTVRVADC